jgi:hypothetical protein
MSPKLGMKAESKAKARARLAGVSAWLERRDGRLKARSKRGKQHFKRMLGHGVHKRKRSKRKHRR